MSDTWLFARMALALVVTACSVVAAVAALIGAIDCWWFLAILVVPYGASGYVDRSLDRWQASQ